MLLNLLAFSGLAAAAVIPRADSGCSNPATRKEWRTLSTEERTSYIDAVKCMTQKPSRIGLETSLYDDFPYVHDKLNNDIHAVASFLPWHRYFVHLYEQALKDCGYTGSATYWDWTLDAADTAHSSIWDAETGIGGNGNNSHTESLGYMSTARCVTDGPFKDLRPAYHGSSYKPHCLGRHFNAGSEDPGDMLSFAYTPEVVDSIQKGSADYATYRYKLEGTPHGAIHSAIGGDMAPSTSPNDPVFFLHHTQIDRLWYLWQQDAPETRNHEFGGNRIPDKFDGTTPPEASATDVMPFLGLADDLLVKDVLSTQTSLLCYKY